MLTNIIDENKQNRRYLKQLAYKIACIKPNDIQAVHDRQFIENNYDKIIRNRRLIELLG